MSSPQRYSDFKGLPKGPKRREAVRSYLRSHKGIRERVAASASVTATMVSKVLHGDAVSARVEDTIAAEESEYANAA